MVVHGELERDEHSPLSVTDWTIKVTLSLSLIINLLTVNLLVKDLPINTGLKMDEK